MTEFKKLNFEIVKEGKKIMVPLSVLYFWYKLCLYWKEGKSHE